ncbi:MAG: GntR family transcriptional regulator [Stappiaceae bacterium]
MVKRNNRYKSIYNQTLDLIKTLPDGTELSTESALSDRLNASRTTIRAVLKHLADEKVIDWRGRHKLILRPPTDTDYFVSEETRSTDEILETAFMQWILSGDVNVGTHLNESEMARNFGVSTSAVREFLIRFSRFGLIKKQPSTGWELVGFTKNFALELSDVRELFETRSVHQFLKQPSDAPCWAALDELETQHKDLQSRVETDYLEFSTLDDNFHRLLNSASDNRFISDFHDLIALIFHYHYRWNKQDERERNTAAIGQHLAIIAGLKARDRNKATVACANHLAAARKTLLRSIVWD